MKRPESVAVASPCTQVCTLDAESGWCLGCLRSIDEIAAWGALDDAGRQRVLAALPARRAAMQAGGHRPQEEQQTP